MESNDFFLQPIQDMPFSEEFKVMASSLKFQNLHDVLEVEGADLIQKPGMSYHIIQELIQFLEETARHIYSNNSYYFLAQEYFIPRIV